MDFIKKNVNPFWNNLFKKTPSTTSNNLFRKDGLNLREVIKSSYNPQNNLNGFIKDKELSNKNQQVYFNPENNRLLMSVAGTHNLKDVGADFQLIGGNIKQTGRYKEADKTLQLAKDKYNTNATVVGHSLGSAVASRIAGTDDKVINYNPAYIGGKDRPNTTNIREAGDIVSVFGAGKSINFGNPINLLSPLSWGTSHSSDRLGNNFFI